MRYTGFDVIDSVEEYRETALKAIDSFQDARQEDALCYFERLREVNPENYVIAEVLTYLYTQAGMTEEADKEFLRYCDLMRGRGRYLTGITTDLDAGRSFAPALVAAARRAERKGHKR